MGNYWDTPAGLAQRERIRAISKEHRNRLPHPKSQSLHYRKISAFNERQRNQFVSICARHNYCCVACGSSKDLTRDHIRPTKLNGSSKPDNIQPLCRRCNEKKHIKYIDYRLNPHPNCLRR